MTTGIDALDPKRLQKIARMELYGIPRKQTALALGISEGRLSQIIDTPQYQEIEQKISLENFEQNELLNRGWDGIEKLSVKRVVEALQADPDPEFALRAAVVANKAQRRGAWGNTPINPQTAGVRAVIQLNATFVEKLQQNFEITKERNTNLLENKKGTNFLSPKSVQSLLMTKAANTDADDGIDLLAIQRKELLPGF